MKPDVEQLTQEFSKMAIQDSSDEEDQEEQSSAEGQETEEEAENSAQQNSADDQLKELLSGAGSRVRLNLPLKDNRKFIVFGDKPDETACELTKRSFETSICKVLPDTAEFPEDIFTLEGCIWCGSKGHDVYNCLGYATWLGDIWMGTKEDGRIPYPQRQQRIEGMLKEARNQHYNPRKPWELFVGLDDGEYLTEKGVKIQIQNSKIVNLIPRHLQTTTTIYGDVPTALEMSRMMHLSDKIQPAAQQLTVMDELCNQAVSMKEELLELEMELKRAMRSQIKSLQDKFQKEMCGLTTLMEDKMNSLPQQLISLREYLSKSLVNLHKRSIQSDITLVRTYRELTEAKTPDSCMIWRSELCQDDPTYHQRGRWRQLADRLNSIAEYTLRANLVVPTTGEQYAEELRDVAELTTEVMFTMFQKAGILDRDDYFDIDDFNIFKEAVSRIIQMQAVSTNQICNFIQQILYYHQCHKKHFTNYMDLKRQLDVFLGILIQTTVKTWDSPGKCKCDFTDRLNCKHSSKYSLMRQHFPTFGLTTMEELMDTLDSISNQTCDCVNHAKFPMHGPSKYIKAPIPTYSLLKKLHQAEEADLARPNLHSLYVKAISSWIYARLFLYLTPYTNPCMNQQPGPVRRSSLEFYTPERQFIENQLCTMEAEMPMSTIWSKIMELGDLKKSHCQCQEHQEDREVNLLYQLKLHNTVGNRHLINRVLEARPLGFTALISSCQQIIGTASQCNLLQYEVTPTTAGTFECSRAVLQTTTT